MNTIANCSISENGTAEGNAGDQTGREYYLRDWYNRPWDVCLYYPDKKVSDEIARQAKNAALNDHIGYGQLAAGENNRLAMYNHLKASKWETSDITVNCNADCSSSTAAIVISAGHKFNLSKLMNISPSLTTWSMQQALTNAGFKVLKGKYLTNANLGFPGLIYLSTQHHVTICVAGDGAFPTVTASTSTTVAQATMLSKGDTGTAVKELQKRLNEVMNAGLAEDGDFGSLTEAAVKKFQTDNKLEVDGVVGPNTLSALSKAKKQTLAQPVYYKIQAGDTLSAIARKYGTTWQDLAKMNNISNPDVIMAGRTIRVK